MTSLRIPVATYRLQFNRNFTFREALGRLDYLRDLGVTDLYASPLLGSRAGSGHGYDVTDSTRLDTDPGSEADFEVLQAGLRERGMGLVLDTVPNHMAASGENPWWMDVLENGPGSAYASYFDIDWHPVSPTLDNKVLLPLLGAPYGQVLENQELNLVYEDGSFFVDYHRERFPLAPKSYRRILRHRLDDLKNTLGEEAPAYHEYQGILAGLAALPERESLPAEAAGERRLMAVALKERLQRLHDSEPRVAAFIEENLRIFHGTRGDAAGFSLMDHLLSEQAYVLAYWQNPNVVINYRRFFTISDLVGLRVEDPLVFEATHKEILRLIERGMVTGLRIDHIDGLRDPLGYLERLQDRIGRAGAAPGFEAPPSGAPGFYVVVEKILDSGESLPNEWPVCGTTGYDFLNLVNRVFVDPHGARTIEEIYQRFSGAKSSYEEVMYEKKKLVMRTLLAVEMRSLARQLGILAQGDRYARDVPQSDLSEALAEISACLPVYRTYTRSLELPEDGAHYVEAAIAEARGRRPDHNPHSFDFVREVLLLRDGDHVFPEQREARLAFVMRWQQLTGPIVAKAVEDTSLYVYNALISLNEVGADPRPVAPESPQFHCFVSNRAGKWPYALNATSTHDTKRAEDVRARINVLSEIPAEWNRRLNRWNRWNASKKTTVDGHPLPDHNEETFIYQTLLGAWPLDQAGMAGLSSRLREYMIKATREAMVHTRWTQPNAEHESALTAFLDGILDFDAGAAPRGRPTDFKADFLKFQEKIARFGMINGLAQVLLKIACPGVPDFYQGSELWDLRLVDPDNRGPVDFDRRSAVLEELKRAVAKSPPKSGPNSTASLIRSLLKHWSDGRIKLYLIWKALDFRRRHPGLFLDGDYLPIEAEGGRAENVVAFARTQGPDHGREHALAIVPRWLARARAPRTPARWSRFWSATRLVLPAGFPACWSNVLTNDRVTCDAQDSQPLLPLDQTLGAFPVALLFSGAKGNP
ncbi:MAG TPA: malto-oligosyltrehalose synthase [Terriglobia bacterium]|nr:malto-oligosyltrehalose synthase [Terriglobia bacterium]